MTLLPLAWRIAAAYATHLADAQRSAASHSAPPNQPAASSITDFWIQQAVQAARAYASNPGTTIAGPTKHLTGQDAIVAALADSKTAIKSKADKKPAKTSSLKPEEQLCSINVSEDEIEKILTMLTAQSGLNIILMSKSPMKLTMHIENMRLIDVMRHVCALTGFSYLNVSGAYVVADPAALKAAYPAEWNALNPPVPVEVKVQPEIFTEAYTANYVKVSQLVDTIKKFIPNDLDIVTGPSPETPSLSSVDPSGKTGQNSVSVTQDSGTTVGTSHIILLRGTRANVDAALKIAKQLDIARQQVSIAVTIHDISDDAVKNLGLSWNFSNFTLTETPAANGLSVGKVTRAPMTFDGAISALESKDVARLLAAPNISVMDGEKAFILIGDRVNYPELVGYTSTNSPIFSVQTERVGIYLQVAASISTDGYITLTLYPQVSSITGYLQVNGASYPQVSSREAQTTLRVKSGEEIVLGGLLQDTEIMNVDTVPILGQIPFFGELFKHRQKTKSKSQVIITIKPVIAVPTPK